jgi:hypothetical protein
MHSRVSFTLACFSITTLFVTGCTKSSYPSQEHEKLAKLVSDKGGDVPLALKVLDSELSFKKGDYKTAFKLANEILESKNQDERDNILCYGNLCKTDESKAEFIKLIDRSKTDADPFIRSRYVYYLMFIPGSDWRKLAEEQKNSTDPLLKEAAEAAIRVGTLREIRKKANTGA